MNWWCSSSGQPFAVCTRLLLVLHRANRVLLYLLLTLIIISHQPDHSSAAVVRQVLLVSIHLISGIIHRMLSTTVPPHPPPQLNHNSRRQLCGAIHPTQIRAAAVLSSRSLDDVIKLYNTQLLAVNVIGITVSISVAA